ncbi:MAG: serine/threonine-protein phosphatase [Acidobacteria bacterium]|nr:serine/threonine-protein phosphatase [Acidobacteriota bacterium]MYA46232.1 serine/threonine-protein phosphatase [Acidobacteriota bacterium]MYB31582.1 serine/threonine-protein phosphatase [Acidobacteriota bacterium]MYH22294.1 serine/threonine-protein phosphatase [Acidobacteriota bacterium]MYI39881.1 serine/threonine-protein phosphatase [Acidobacteriota bacterium]
MSPDLQFGGGASVGARRRQEDAWETRALPRDENGVRLVAVVADGLGGHPGGDQASRTACDGFLAAFPDASGSPRERLREALQSANAQLRAAIEASPELWGMGTTLVAACFHAGGCDWISVGDSFLFHYRSGRIRRVNPLHTVGAELDERARRGEITEAEAAADPERPLITSVVMGLSLEEVAAGSMRLEPDDLVILATDGVETLGEDGIASVCGEQRGAGAEEVATAIIRRIEEIGSWNQDNATVVVVRQPRR